MRAFGIDVSTWQGDFDFARAKSEGVTFAIIKGGGGDDGLYIDRRFADNYNKAKAQGLNVGAYWFSKALTVADAEREADYFFDNCCKGRQFDLPVYIDVENKAMLSVGKDALTQIILAWVLRMQSHNMVAGVYSFLNAFRSYFYDAQLGDIPRWVACWSETCSYKPLGIWQFGGETNPVRFNKIAGVVCDQDFMLVDYPAQIKAAKKNGYSEPDNKDNDDDERTWVDVKLPLLHRGWTGGYVRTAQILLNAYFDAGLAVDGVFGPATEKAVFDYQRNRGLQVDGYIGTETWGQLLK